jgi:anti-sigma B factor antagonist
MNGVPVLRPRGEVDIAAVTRLRPTWLALAEARRPVVVVDLSEVTFMDVVGVGLLAALLNRQHAHGGQVHLRQVPAQVTRLLELTGLAALLPIEPIEPIDPTERVDAGRTAADVIDLRHLEDQPQLRD